MKIRPIPKKLLVHSAMLYKMIEEDRWGKSHLDDGIALEKIKIEPTTQIVRDANNAEVQLSAMLFFDCENSRPKGTAFQVDDIIVFNSEGFRVKTVEPLYAETTPHHYEVGLIKGA